MGNRANVIFGDPSASVSVYLHWNGSPESVYTMLDVLFDDLKVRNDDMYGPARFCQMAGNFFGGTLSLGVRPGPTDRTVKGVTPWLEDNGAYWVRQGTRKGHVAVDRYVGDRRLTADQVDAERAEAAAHSYNANDEMRKDILAKNAALAGERE